MKLNIDEIKSKLNAGIRSLVDPTILKEDSYSMYKYYKELPKDELPTQIEWYFRNYLDFNYIEFASCYLSHLFNHTVELSFTEDNYVSIDYPHF